MFRFCLVILGRKVQIISKLNVELTTGNLCNSDDLNRQRVDRVKKIKLTGKKICIPDESCIFMEVCLVMDLHGSFVDVYFSNSLLHYEIQKMA